jgi:hypothetical protein
MAYRRRLNHTGSTMRELAAVTVVLGGLRSRR